MSATTFLAALSTAFANGHGKIETSVSGLTGATPLVQLAQIGNTTVTMDDNYAYLTTTQGAANASANGFAAIFGGVAVNWGVVNANSSVGSITFQVPFSVNAFSVVATSNTSAAYPFITTVNNTVATIRTAAVGASIPCNFIAIGQ
jgi:hypothetical protein